MDPILSASLHEGIKSLYLDNALTDVVIRVDDQTFPCHRLVLSAVSPYFQSMFTSDFNDKDMKEVVLQSVKPEIFKCILRYIYISEESVINENNVQDILITASMFLMQRVVTVCENFISDMMSTQNVVNVWRFAESLPSTMLSRLSKDLILREFENIAKSDDFLDLKTDEIIEIIRDQSLNVGNEEIVGDSVFRWLSAKEDARKTDLFEVLQHVRLPLTRPEYVFTLCKRYPFLYENLKIGQLLDETKSFHCQKRGPNTYSVTSKRFVHRDASEIVNGLICVMGDFVQLYSFQDKMWIDAALLPSDPGYLFASCVFGNNLYLSGGSNSLGDFFKYRSEENCWVSLSKLGKLRFRHALVADSQMMYLVGGTYDHEEVTSDVTEYNRNQNSYRHIGNLDTAVRSMGAVLMGQKIYIFGGKLDEIMKGSRMIQYFDLSTNQGSRITTELFLDVSFTGATEVGQYVFLVGGDGQLMKWSNDILRKSHSCSILRVLNNKFLKVSMCYFDGQLYICTGNKEEMDIVHVETGKHDILNCHPRLTTSHNKCVVDAVFLPRKYFRKC